MTHKLYSAKEDVIKTKQDGSFCHYQPSGSKEANIASNNLEKKKQVGAKARAKKDDSGGKSIPIPRNIGRRS